MESKIVSTPGLQWLVLADEGKVRYTNFGDGRLFDAPELIAKVNTDPALGCGRTDWRLPSIEELKSLVGTHAHPMEGWFWSSSPCEGNSNFALYAGFGKGNVYDCSHGDYLRVRLVRASQ